MTVVDQAAAVLAERARSEGMGDFPTWYFVWFAAALDEAGLLAAGETSTEALAKAWDQGMRTGTSRAMRRMSDEPGLPLASDTDNPYRADTASEWVPVSDQEVTE